MSALSAQDENIARQLDQAAREARATPQFPAGSFSLDTAYVIQRASIAQRVARGNSIIGIKLGFTSRAKMVQMGVNDLIWGWLTEEMLEEEGGEVNLGRYIHPRVEPEVCFLTSRTIDRPINGLDAINYIEAVAPALEIIDSRYENFKFSLEDVVADNCSSAGLVLGDWCTDWSDLSNAGVNMGFNGRPVQLGSTAAILGNPMRSVMQASRLLAADGLSLPAGSLIMAGAATAAQALQPGTHVHCDIHSLGRVEFFTSEAA